MSMSFASWPVCGVCVAPILVAEAAFFANGSIESPISTMVLLGGAGTVIALLFKLLIGAKDQLLASKQREYELAYAELMAEKAEETSRKKSYQEIATEAIKSATDTANYYRQKEGKSPIIPLAPVVSESHSPSTEKQRETAIISTLRAEMAKVKLMTGQEPRPEPERAVEVPRAAPPPLPLPTSPTLIEAMSLKEEIARVPEKTAEKVVEKLADQAKEEGAK